MEREVFVVPHTHWDREWYRPLELFRWRLVQMVDALVDHMEADPGFRCFNLDGQSIVIDDYLQLRPENEPRLRRLIEDGRVLIGPWWVQPDEFLPTGESHIRNFQRGIRYAARLGGSMRVGHCADQFGHIAQMPQLMAQLGLTSACLWRGVPGTVPGWSFWWEAPDGTRLPVLYLRDSYSSAWRLPSNPATLRDWAATATDARSPGEPALLMNGTDHSSFEPHLPGALTAATGNGYRFRMATLEEYEAAVLAAGVAPHVHRGELRSPARSNILVGVASARMNLKQHDFQVQSWLERYAEPLELLAYLHHGQDAAPALRQAWSLQLENAPHDSICGCSVDQVHREMLPRYDRAEQLAIQVARESLGHLAGRTGIESPGALLVFRPVPSAPALLTAEIPAAWDTDALVVPGGDDIPVSASPGEPPRLLSDIETTPQRAARLLDFVRENRYEQYSVEDVRVSLQDGCLVVEVDAGDVVSSSLVEAAREEAHRIVREGLATTGRFVARRSATRRITAVLPPVDSIRVDALHPVSHAPRHPTPAVTANPGDATITNDCYDVRYDAGSLVVRDRETGLELHGIASLLDEGDRGDEYNADIIPDAAGVEHSASLLSVEHDAARAALRFETVLAMPPALDTDRSRRAGSHESLVHVTTTATLYAGLPRIDLHLDVHNQADDHRLRLLCPFPFETTHAITENQFHVARRPLQVEPWDAAAAEEPPSTFPQKAFAAVEGDGHGLAVFNRGLPEGEIVTLADGRQAYALTLLRCVGWLSRNDLRSRRGHAGPFAATFDSQLHGHHTFECALATYRGDWRTAGILPMAHAFAHPPLAIPALSNPQDAPASHALVAFDSPVVIPSACYRSEEDGASVIRVWSAASEAREFHLSVPAGMHPRRTDLLENPTGNVAGEPGAWRLPLRPWEIATLRFEPATES